jgi:multiple sugar transport system permease protein
MGYLFLLPAVLVLMVVVIYPALIGLWYSFQNRMIGFPKVEFVGLRNYVELLGDARLRISIVRSLLFAGGVVSLKLVIGLLVALFLNQTFGGRGFIRSIVLLPWSLPLVVSVLIFTWMYNDMFGVFNFLLIKGGLIDLPLIFLGDRKLALLSGLLINVWRGIPFFAINLLAGLQAIPDELYDAGQVDGASSLQLFRHVTLPSLRTVMLIVFLLSFIWTSNDFTTFWILTRGGPGTATEVFSIVTYKIAFIGLELGKAAAVPVLLMPFFSVLIVLLVKAVRGQEEGR